MVDLVIHGGRVVTRGRIADQWIAVHGGTVVAIGAAGTAMPAADHVIDATGKHVLPGVIDSENHTSGTGFDRIAAETAAGIAAGVTTIGIEGNTTDFVVPRQKEPPREAVPAALDVLGHFEAIERDRLSMADFFFTPVLTEAKQLTEMRELATDHGVTSFKARLHTKAGEANWAIWREARAQGMYQFDDGLVYAAMRNVAELGAPALLLLHCENWEIGRVRRSELIAQGRTDAGAWYDMSPPFAEAGHIRTYAYYANVTGCPILIRHTTCEESFDEIRKARAEGTRIIGNSNTHYWTIDRSQWRTNVPHRDRSTFPRIWQAIRDGEIDTVSSDNIFGAMRLAIIEEWEQEHGPIAEGGPRYPFDDIFEGAGEKGSDAMAGRLEGLLPMMLSEGVNKGNITLERAVEVLCENPAKAFGLYPRKGVIAPGADADIVIVDLERTLRLTRDHVLNSSGWSLFEGRDITGWPVMTILRGVVQMEWPDDASHRRIVGTPDGRYLKRSLSSAAG